MKYTIIETEKGKLAVNIKTAKIVEPENICQCCSKLLTPTDLLDYICNQCEAK